MSRVGGLARVFTLALALLAPVAEASARDWTAAPRSSEAAAPASERVNDRSGAGWEAQAKIAAQIQKAREDEWDRKTRRATRSICTGAKGC